MPQVPINPYGESKLLFEKILRWYDEIHGLKYVALRYFNAAGATEKYGEDHRIETHLIPNVLKVALGQREAVDIYGTDYPTPDGSCIRDYIHILDLAQAHILALKAEKSERFNLGTGGGTSVKEVIDTCREVTGKDIKAVEKPRRPGDPPRLIASSERNQRRRSDGSQSFRIFAPSSKVHGPGMSGIRAATGTRAGTELSRCSLSARMRNWLRPCLASVGRGFLWPACFEKGVSSV